MCSKFYFMSQNKKTKIKIIYNIYFFDSLAVQLNPWASSVAIPDYHGYLPKKNELKCTNHKMSVTHIVDLSVHLIVSKINAHDAINNLA